MVLIVDEMLSKENLEIIKWKGEKAYYEEVLRRYESQTEPHKREECSRRDERILRAIRASVAELFGVPYASLMDGTRKREKVEMRYLVFLVAREFSNSTDADFVKLFPAYDRVTINYHSLRKAKELMEIDPRYAERYARLKESVNRMLKESE